jgi:site-specific recombinase XerD
VNGADVVAAFQKELARRGRSPVTMKNVLATVTRFLAFAAKPLEFVTSEDVRRHLAARSESVTATSQASELCHLRVFFRWAMEVKLCPCSPVAGMTVKHAKSPPQLLLGEGSIRALLDAAAKRFRARPVLAFRDLVALELLYGAGLRASELGRVLVVDVSFEDASLLVRRAKRGESRRLPLPAPAMASIQRYLEETRPRLCRFGRDEGALVLSGHGRPLHRGDIWSIVSQAGKRAGFRAYPHAMRRALATHLVRSGVSVRAVQILLGHQSLETTQVYVGVDRDDLRRAVDLLDA